MAAVQTSPQNAHIKALHLRSINVLQEVVRSLCIQTHRPGTDPKAVGMGVSSSPIANLRAKTRHQDSPQAAAPSPPPYHAGYSIMSCLFIAGIACHLLCNIACGAFQATNLGPKELFKSSQKHMGALEMATCHVRRQGRSPS